MNDELDDRFALVGTTLLGRYSLDRVAARGGFGTVYQGHHVELRAPVAIKVLMVPPHFEGALREDFIEKFKVEARTIATLNHGAIVRAHDYGVVATPLGDAPWMALEWLDGVTLEDDLAARRAEGGRRPSECLALLRPAFDALACAHERGVAHRDIKPANLMIVRARRGEPGVRLLDFGIAKVMEPAELAGTGETATQATLQSFSPMYAAPEQVGRMRTGPWTDVHALALVLIECVIGRIPYAGEDLSQVFASALDRVRPTPGAFGVDVGPWEGVLARALALRPTDRHRDAGALLAALDAAASAADDAWQRPRAGGPPGLDSGRVSTMIAAPPITPLAPVTSVIPPARPSSRRALWVALLSLVALGATIAYGLPRLASPPRSVAALRRLPDAPPDGSAPAPIAPAELPALARDDAATPGAAATTDAAAPLEIRRAPARRHHVGGRPRGTGQPPEGAQPLVID